MFITDPRIFKTLAAKQNKNRYLLNEMHVFFMFFKWFYEPSFFIVHVTFIAGRKWRWSTQSFTLLEPRSGPVGASFLSTAAGSTEQLSEGAHENFKIHDQIWCTISGDFEETHQLCSCRDPLTIEERTKMLQNIYRSPD